MNTNSPSGMPGDGRGKQKKSIKRWLVPLSIIVVGYMVMVGGSMLKPPPEIAPKVEVTRPVDVIEVSPSDFNHVVNTQGVVAPKTETTLVAEVSGKITKVADVFNAGGYFQQGDVLLEIDPSDYEVALKRAQATLASRQAKLAEEVARADQARKDWNNLKRSGQPSDLVLRRPQLADAQANVRAAEADVEKAERDLERTQITAPYTGLVRDRTTDLGQYVTPGASLGTVFAISVAEIRMPITVAQRPYVDWPSPRADESGPLPDAMLKASYANQQHQWMAKVVRTEAVLDEMTRLYYVVAEVEDPYNLISSSNRPALPMGTFVSAEIIGRATRNTVKLPRHTIQTNNTVLVMDENNELQFREVTIARTDNELAYISDGLDAGERVITTAIDLPFAGMKLRLNSDEQSDASAGEDLMASTDNVEAATVVTDESKED